MKKFQERSGNSKKDRSENPRTNIISESKNNSVHRINRLDSTEDSSIKIIQIKTHKEKIFKTEKKPHRDGGNSGNSIRLFLGGLQNHCRW